MWHTIEKTDLARKLKTNLLYGITEEEAQLSWLSKVGPA